MSQHLPTPLDPEKQRPPPVMGDTVLLPEAVQEVGFDQFQDEPDEAPFNWRRYVSALYRYKWLILVTTLLGIGGGIGATKFLTPIYQTAATIWIESGGEGDKRGQTGPIRSGNLLDAASWVELLKSFEVLVPVAEEERLFLESTAPTALFEPLTLGERIRPGRYVLDVNSSGREFVLATVDGLVIQRGVPGDSMGTDLGLHWVPSVELLRPGDRVEFTLQTPHAVASSMRQRLVGLIDRDAQFMRVTLSDQHQDRVAPMLNAILARYVDLAAELKRARLTEETKVLTEQLARAELELVTAEAALQRFQVETITQPTEPEVPLSAGTERTTPTVFNSYFVMKFTQDDLKNDRVALAEFIASLPDSGLSLDEIGAIPAVQASGDVSGLLATLRAKRGEVRQALSQYTAEHGSVRRVQREVQELETVDIPRALNQLAIEIDARIADYDDRLTVVADELKEIPPRFIEEQRRLRNVAIAAQIYTTLESRYQSAQLAEASSIPDIRILDRAVAPREPMENRAPQLLLIAIAAGLGVGVAGAILLDLLDKRVRYPEQVTKLGLHILGGIPRVSGGRRGLQGDDLNQIIESLRGIRLNLIHACGGSGPLLLTITSPGGGDGKSFVSSNLALAFAEAGHRTILIDGDIRRGRQHKLFNVARKPGLTEVLTGEAARDDVVQQTEFSYLSFLPCGTRTHNAPELLGSATMSQMLSALRATYSVIIVDSPPMAAGIDAFTLGSLTKNLMLVIRNGTTDRDLAGAKLDILHRLPINVLGAVLNDIKPGGPYGYYGYYTYYLPGYAAEDEIVESDKLVLKQEATT